MQEKYKRMLKSGYDVYVEYLIKIDKNSNKKGNLITVDKIRHKKVISGNYKVNSFQIK